MQILRDVAAVHLRAAIISIIGLSIELGCTPSPIAALHGSQGGRGKPAPTERAVDRPGDAQKRSTSEAAAVAAKSEIDDGVPACPADKNILIAQNDANKTRVIEIRLDGMPIKTWFEHASELRPAVDVRRRIAIGFQGLVRLDNGALTAIAEAEQWAWPVLVPGQRLVISPVVQRSDDEPPLIDVYDFGKYKLVHRLAGYSPSLVPSGAVLYLAAESDHVDVMRVRVGAAKPQRLQRIHLSKQGGPYAITEIVAFTDNEYVYRVYDEHEYRYYDQRGRPFFPSEEGHYMDKDKTEYHGGQSKEQFDLTVSDDASLVAFTERSWNELTYLVVVDRRKKTRVQTALYGSFPVIDSGRVLFVSDPAFIKTQNPQFRQIEHFAIYAYDIAKRFVCRVARYSGPAGPYPVR